MSMSPPSPPTVPPALPDRPVAAPPAKLKPSAGWFVVGAVLLVAAVAAAIAIIVSAVIRVSDEVDGFARFPVDGVGRTIEFSEPGTYVVYYEWRSEIDGVQFNTPEDPPTFTLTIVDASGNELPLERERNDVSFSFQGIEGKAVAKVEIPAAGRYDVTVEVAEGTPPFVLSFGPSVVNRLVGPVVLALVIGAVGFVVGLVILIVTATRRSRAKRARRFPPAGPGVPLAAAPGPTAPAPGPWAPPAPGSGAPLPPPGATAWPGGAPTSPPGPPSP